MIIVKKTTITPAQVYTALGTPVSVLPAPPSGMCNNILGCSVEMTYVSTPYSPGTQAYLQHANLGNNVNFIHLTLLGAVGNVNMPWQRTLSNQTVYSTTKELFFATQAIESLGDSPIDVFIIYEEKPIS